MFFAKVACLTAALALLVGVADAQAPMSRSDAIAIARTVNLTAHDMPGYSPKRQPPDVRPNISGVQFARCAGSVPATVAIADRRSNEFERKGSGRFDAASSEVEVMPNAALVKKDLAAVVSARGRRCMNSRLGGIKAGPGVTIIGGRVMRIAAPAAGVVGFRIAVVIEAKKVIAPIFIDAFGMGRGPVEASVAFTSAPLPPVRAEERRVVGVVKSRLSQVNPSQPDTPTIY